jgi:quercetin dioxygenase-like cupin family protein
MRPSLSLGAVLFFLVALAIESAMATGQPPTNPVVANVEAVTAPEWNVITVELTPGARDARHFHPGVEFVYVIEGSGRLELEGELPVPLEPGTISAFLPRQLHVLKNTSQTETLKVLIVF